MSTVARADYNSNLRDVIAKRRVGMAPNYEGTHQCPAGHGCGREYLCPDRYTEPSCAVKFRQQLCSPCAGQFDPEQRALWYEAHGI